MSNVTRNRSFILGGSMYLREKGAAAGMLNVGNASDLSLAINEDKKTQRNFQQAGGGNIASISAITDVTASVTVLSFQPSTLAVALRSLVNTVAATSIVSEAQTAYLEGFIELDAVPDLTTIVVNDVGAVTTYVEGTDYEVKTDGIIILEGSNIPDGDPIEVTYDSLESYTIEGITLSSVEYEVYFSGFNDADNGKAVGVKFHKVKFSPASALALISEDFGELPMEFEVLADTTKNGTSDSQYFNVKMTA